jgi:hypothetical protein
MEFQGVLGFRVRPWFISDSSGLLTGAAITMTAPTVRLKGLFREKTGTIIDDPAYCRVTA